MATFSHRHFPGFWEVRLRLWATEYCVVSHGKRRRTPDLQEPGFRSAVSHHKARPELHNVHTGLQDFRNRTTELSPSIKSDQTRRFKRRQSKHFKVPLFPYLLLPATRLLS